MMDAYIDGAGLASLIILSTAVYAALALAFLAVILAIWRRL